MGLDMYLSRKKYIGANYDHRNVDAIISITIGGKKVPIDIKKISYIEEAVGYWRKANQIHNWFVENVQDGEDDCKSYSVDIEDLKELLDLCRQVKKEPNRAEELLPTCDGFFFGNTEYGEMYMEDIDYTIELLEKLIKEEEEYNANGFYSEFEYFASW